MSTRKHKQLETCVKSLIKIQENTRFFFQIKDNDKKHVAFHPSNIHMPINGKILRRHCKIYFHIYELYNFIYVIYII